MDFHVYKCYSVVLTLNTDKGVQEMKLYIRSSSVWALGKGQHVTTQERKEAARTSILAVFDFILLRLPPIHVQYVFVLNFCPIGYQSHLPRDCGTTCVLLV